MVLRAPALILVWAAGGHEFVRLGHVQQERLADVLDLVQAVLAGRRRSSRRWRPHRCGSRSGRRAGRPGSSRWRRPCRCIGFAAQPSMVACDVLDALLHVEDALNSSKARFHSASVLSVMSMPGSIRQNRSGRRRDSPRWPRAVADVAHDRVDPEDLLDRPRSAGAGAVRARRHRRRRRRRALDALVESARHGGFLAEGGAGSRLGGSFQARP